MRGLLTAWLLLLVSVGAGANLTQTTGSRIRASVTVTPTEPTTVDEAALFAFDDLSIPFANNLVLTMHAPRKHPGNPVLPLGKRGEPDEFKIDYTGTVLRHAGNDLSKMRACARAGEHLTSLYSPRNISMSYATSVAAQGNSAGAVSIRRCVDKARFKVVPMLHCKDMATKLLFG